MTWLSKQYVFFPVNVSLAVRTLLTLFEIGLAEVLSIVEVPKNHSYIKYLQLEDIALETGFRDFWCTMTIQA